MFANYINNGYMKYQGGVFLSINYFQMAMWYPWEGHSRA